MVNPPYAVAQIVHITGYGCQLCPALSIAQAQQDLAGNGGDQADMAETMFRETHGRQISISLLDIGSDRRVFFQISQLHHGYPVPLYPVAATACAQSSPAVPE